MEYEIYKMTYQIKNSSNGLRILGNDFATNNGNKGKLIINNKKYYLKDFILVNEIIVNKIKMILDINIYNKGSMFKNCESLISLSKILINNEQELLDKDNYNN